MCPEPLSWAKNKRKPSFLREVERTALSKSGTLNVLRFSTEWSSFPTYKCELWYLDKFLRPRTPQKKRDEEVAPRLCGAFSLTSTQKIPRLLRFFTHFYTTLKLSALLSPLITQLNSPIGKIFPQSVYLNCGEVRSFSGRYCYVHQASLGFDKFGTSYTRLTIRK